MNDDNWIGYAFVGTCAVLAVLLYLSEITGNLVKLRERKEEGRDEPKP